MRTVNVDGQGLRPEIAQSWTRASICGLTPATIQHVRDGDVDQDSAFARSAFPVLDSLRTQIDGGRFAFMLTDRSARLVKTVLTDSSLNKALSSMGGEVGTVWSEELTGTNALATPFATRRPIFIRGEEHFVVAMKPFSCYGAPIVDPVTGHIEGVLDIMMDAGAESPLMRSVVDQAVRRIQHELEENRSAGQRRLVAAFTKTSATTVAPVVAVNDDVVLTNSAAAGVFSAADLDRLRDFAEVAPIHSNLALALQNGQDAEVTLVERTDAGAVFSARLAGRAMIPRTPNVSRPFARLEESVSHARAASPTSVVVTGEPGTGKSATANAVLDGSRFDSLDCVLTDPSRVRSRILDHVDLCSSSGLLVENFEHLPQEVQSVLVHAAQASSSTIVATCDSSESAVPDALLSRFSHRIDLRPLREMRHDMPAVVRAVSPTSSYRFDSAAMNALTEYSWPGNLSELVTVLGSLESTVRNRVIGFSDLPHNVRAVTERPLTPWQRASRDALVNALEVHRDNKSHAAQYLGISRSSLYHHMREFGLS